MKALKLTPKQREIFELLKKTEGGVLRQHVKMTNTLCYRLLDKDRNPVYNIRQGIVRDLIDKDVLELQGIDYVLKATSEKW